MIIVTIALIKARIKNAPLIARDFMQGSTKPDKIIFCISPEPYMLDEGVKRGYVKQWHPKVSFKIVKNTGPIRRIAPLVKEFWYKPETKIIIWDDDRRPSPDLVSKLVNYSNKHPDIAFGAAGNMFFEAHRKPYWKGKGVIYDSKHHKDVGIVLGWAIKKSIPVDVMNPGVGMLVKPRFFSWEFVEWEKVYSDWLGISRSDQTFISYSLNKNGIKRVVVPLNYQSEYPSHGVKLCGVKAIPFKCLMYKKRQLNTLFRTKFEGESINL